MMANTAPLCNIVGETMRFAFSIRVKFITQCWFLTFPIVTKFLACLQGSNFFPNFNERRLEVCLEELIDQH